MSTYECGIFFTTGEGVCTDWFCTRYMDALRDDQAGMVSLLMQQRCCRETANVADDVDARRGRVSDDD